MSQTPLTCAKRLASTPAPKIFDDLMGPFSDPAGPECGFQRGRERLSKKKQDVRLGTRLTNPSFYSRNENVQRRTDLKSYLGLDRHEVSNKITIWSRFWLFGCKTSAEFIQVQGFRKIEKGNTMQLYNSTSLLSCIFESNMQQ